MKFEKRKNEIEIFGKEDFCPAHILECGQIFSYQKFEGEAENWDVDSSHAYALGEKCGRVQTSTHIFDVFSLDKKAEIFENRTGYLLKTDDPDFFVNFFDLQTDYSQIKTALSAHPIMKEPIQFGHGIRILRQDLFETLISFIVSANNNIKRIQLILGRMREKFGKNMGDFFAFPTRESLLQASVADFNALGAGYRAEYLFKVLRQVDENMLQQWRPLPTEQLRSKLIALSGVGPKVADCVLLFGYGRGDVFPVDTWVEKVFHHFYGEQNLSRAKIREVLTGEFGGLSGYAQQYLFNFMRSGAGG